MVVEKYRKGGFSEVPIIPSAEFRHVKHVIKVEEGRGAVVAMAIHHLVGATNGHDGRITILSNNELVVEDASIHNFDTTFTRKSKWFPFIALGGTVTVVYKSRGGGIADPVQYYQYTLKYADELQEGETIQPCVGTGF